MSSSQGADASVTDAVRVLYVDGDADAAAEFAARVGGVRGALTVTTVPGATDGLDALAAGDVDCVVSAYRLPEADGVAFLEAVREARPDLPFVLFAADGSESVAGEAVAAGVTEYVPRDGDGAYERLVERVLAAVSERRSNPMRASVETPYRQLVERAPAPFVVVDADRRIAYANRAATEALGADRPERLVGRDAVSLVHPADRDLSARRLRAVLDASDPAPTREIRLLGFDGETRYVDVAAAPVTYRGRPAAQIAFTDVTGLKRTKAELRSTSGTLASLVEAIPAGILAEDGSRTVTFVNRRFTDLFGVPAPPDELVGRDAAAVAETVADLFRDSDRFLDRTARSAAERTAVRREEFDLVDGRTVERSGTPVRIDDDRVGHLWVYRDVTRRKDRERELREERALVDSILDTLPDAFYAFDADGTPLRWNDRLSEITGYADEEIAEMEVTDFVAPDDADRMERAIAEAIETGYASVEVSVRTKSGECHPYEFNGSRITDEKGEFLGVAGTGRDIAHHKRYEHALTSLHDATRRLAGAETKREVAEVASRSACDALDIPLNGVHLYDPDADRLVPTAVSPRARELLADPPALPRDGGIAWRAFEAGAAQVYDDVRESEDAFNPETPVRSGLYLPLGDHGVFLAGSTVVGDFDETDVSLAKIFAANVQAALDRADREGTLREREASLSRQNEWLDRFASILSHDIRGPLNVAQGRVELAADEFESDGDGDGDHLETALRALDRIEELVGDVLTLAREGRDASDAEPVALADAADESAEVVGLPDSALAVADDLGAVEADPERLRTLFENLFRNSLEHGSAIPGTAPDDGTARGADDGADGVSVRVGPLADGDGFYVEDDGPGVPPEERERVFDHGYSTTDDGTGIGLSIVASVAEAHGWTVAASEGSDGGARFEVRGVNSIRPRRRPS